MISEIKIVDYGRFIYIIPKGIAEVIILDKKEDDVDVELSSLIQYYGNIVEGSTYVEDYFISGLVYGETYSDMEKWWNYGKLSHKLLLGGCKMESSDFFYPQYKTSDFSKEELRAIDKFAQRNKSITRDILGEDDIMLIKEVLKKDVDDLLRLSHKPAWYFEAIKEGRLTLKAFLTLKDGIILRDMEYLKQKAEALSYDLVDVKIPYEFHEEVGNFIIRAPLNYLEIAEEGRYMGNCIGGYVKRVALKDTKVFFMRRIGDENTPFMDIEVDSYGDLCQALLRFNQLPDDDLLDLIEYWREEHGFGLDSGFNDYGEDEDFIEELRPDFQMAYTGYLE